MSRQPSHRWRWLNALTQRGRVQAGQPRMRAPFDLRKRMWLVGVGFASAVLYLVWHALDLQVINHAFYQRQGDARFLREIPIALFWCFLFIYRFLGA